MTFFKLLTASAVMASLAASSALADSGQNSQTACYTHRHDYGYPYRGYDGYDYPGANANNCGNQAAPAAVASAGPASNNTWNGDENSLGANSAGGGNRYAHTAPVAATVAIASNNTWDGGENSLGANSAGGGNR
jgi:hypothetical protein